MDILFRGNRNAILRGGAELPLRERCQDPLIHLRTEALQHATGDDISALVNRNFDDLISDHAVERIRSDDWIRRNDRQGRANLKPKDRSNAQRSIG